MNRFKQLIGRLGRRINSLFRRPRGRTPQTQTVSQAPPIIQNVVATPPPVPLEVRLKPLEEVVEVRKFNYLAIACGEVIGIGLLLAYMASKAFGFHGIDVYFWVGISWLALVAFTPIHKQFFVDLGEHAGVAQDVLGTYLTRSSGDPNVLPPAPALRELYPGTNGLLLTERVYARIDVNKQIKVDEKVEGLSKDQVPIVIKFNLILTALQGRLTNLVRHDEGTPKSTLVGEFKKRLQLFFNLHDADKLRSKEVQEAIEVEFKNILGGSSRVHPMEENMGTFTNDPQITSIDYTDEYKRALESKANAKKNKEAIAEYQQGFGLSAKQALMAAMAYSNIPTEGLEDRTYEVDLKSVPPTLKSLNLTIYGGGGGQGGGGGGKKNKNKGNNQT